MVSRIQSKYISGETLKNLIKNKHENLFKRPLTREEIKHTEHIWVKALQENQSSSDKFMKIKWSLKLFVDDNEIVRCQSRLCETKNLFFNYCNPTNIPHEENFIKLQSFTKYLRQTHMK